MTSKKPNDRTELQALLGQGGPVYTRVRDGVEAIDFSQWNHILDLDTENLTVTAERGVTLGQLEDVVNQHGLHMAAMTEDLREMTLGDFFADQAFCLTALYHNQPRFQVLGLEVMLADGTLLQVAGKTVKNVTGYDMCRFYISNRETLAIPLAFTIKLVSREPVSILLEAEQCPASALAPLVRAMRAADLTPKVCLYWNQQAASAIGQRDSRLILVCSGDKEQVERQLAQISQMASSLLIPLHVSEQPEAIWQSIAQLRAVTTWQNGIKVPSLACPALIQQLEQQNIGCWYNPMEGSLQLMEAQADSGVYQALCQQAAAAGGAGNSYYSWQYGFAPAGELRLWQQLKEKFDPQNRLNPGEKGAVTNG